jgi:diaminopimelate decarboxylase
MDHFQIRDGVMHAEDVPLTLIADRVGTPVYVYSTATMARHVRVFREALAGIEDPLIAFAVKANPNLAVLATLAKLGLGADVVSAGELLRARAAGVPAARIVFSGVGKTADEMALALREGIGAGGGNAVAGGDGAWRGGPRRFPDQSRCRGRHPRQDRDRRIGGQVRRCL